MYHWFCHGYCVNVVITNASSCITQILSAVYIVFINSYKWHVRRNLFQTFALTDIIRWKRDTTFGATVAWPTFCIKRNPKRYQIFVNILLAVHFMLTKTIYAGKLNLELKKRITKCLIRSVWSVVLLYEIHWRHTTHALLKVEQRPWGSATAIPRVCVLATVPTLYTLTLWQK